MVYFLDHFLLVKFQFSISQIRFCDRNNTCKFLIKYSKIKLVQYDEKTEKKYDPNIETVKYVELIDQK